MENRLITVAEFEADMAEALGKLSPAEQHALCYSIQTMNGFPRDKKMEKKIADELACQRADARRDEMGEEE